MKKGNEKRIVYGREMNQVMKMSCLEGISHSPFNRVMLERSRYILIGKKKRKFINWGLKEEWMNWDSSLIVNHLIFYSIDINSNRKKVIIDWFCLLSEITYLNENDRNSFW